jgi:hypothetical protein
MIVPALQIHAPCSTRLGLLPSITAHNPQPNTLDVRTLLPSCLHFPAECAPPQHTCSSSSSSSCCCRLLPSGTSTCDVWEVDADPRILIHGQQADLYGLAVNPRYTHVYATMCDSNVVTIWSAATHKVNTRVLWMLDTCLPACLPAWLAMCFACKSLCTIHTFPKNNHARQDYA